jgi:hypothetical protein
MLEAQAIPTRPSDIIHTLDVHLELRGASQHEVLSELVSSLTLSAANSDALVKVLQRRESMGSIQSPQEFLDLIASPGL